MSYFFGVDKSENKIEDDSIECILRQISDDFNTLPYIERKAVSDYSEARRAFRRYLSARDLFNKYKNKPIRVGMIQSLYDNTYLRHLAKIAVLGRITKKRWEEYQVIVKLVGDY